MRDVEVERAGAAVGGDVAGFAVLRVIASRKGHVGPGRAETADDEEALEQGGGEGEFGVAEKVVGFGAGGFRRGNEVECCWSLRVICN